MNKFTTKAIILKRVNYGEADRIVTILTPEVGSITGIAKAVRKPQSKLAGGLELFSESDITVLKGKSNLDHIISARLIRHASHIVEDYDRVEAAYKAIEYMYKLNREVSDQGMYEILRDTIFGLDEKSISIALATSWFMMNVLKVLGSQPNIESSEQGKLKEDKTYTFDYENGQLREDANGNFTANEIKAWRLIQSKSLNQLKSVSGLDEPLRKSLQSLDHFFRFTLSV